MKSTKMCKAHQEIVLISPNRYVALLQAIPGEIFLDQGLFVFRGHSGKVSNKDICPEKDQGDEK